jgi:hypothetical protein
MLRLIFKALGEKSGSNDKEANRVALIRLFMFLSILITNCFIIFGVTKTHIFPSKSKPVECVLVNK